MGAPVDLLAKALSLDLDGIVTNVEFAAAPEDFELPVGPSVERPRWALSLNAMTHSESRAS